MRGRGCGGRVEGGTDGGRGQRMERVVRVRAGNNSWMR